MTKKGMTPERFAVDVLHGIGVLNPSKADINFLLAWEAKEGGHWHNTARHNPLNTSLPEPGSAPYAAGKGVQAYRSWRQGLKATVSTLTESRYSGVVAGLKTGNTTSALEALKESPWDAAHYAGWNPPTVGKDTVKPSIATAAAKHAARRLYNAGLRGDTLVVSMAIIGAMTKGKYAAQTVTHFLSSFKANGGHLKKTLGSSLYENGDYLGYIGSAQVNLKAVGHDTRFSFGSHFPGLEGTGGPSALQQGADTLSDAGGKVIDGIESVPKLIGWVTDPDNLIRIGLIAVAVILFTVGIVKLTGASLPNVKVGP